MAQRFEATATGLLDGFDYRVEIYDDRYTNASIEGTLADERQWITWNVGEEDDDGTRPIKPHEVTLSVIETTDLSVLRPAAEDDLRIEVYHDGSGTQAYKGFLSPNRIATRPLGPQPDVVTLSGTEGLPLLRKSDVSTLPWSGNDQVTYMTAIRTILNDLYVTSLPIEIGVDWFPAGSPPSQDSDLPLQFRDIPTDALREDPSDPSSDWRNLYDALKDLLEPFEATVQQSRRLGGVAWWISQWDAYKSDGHIDTWEVQPGGTTTYRGDQDVLVDLDALTDNQFFGEDNQPVNDPGEPGRRRQEIIVTYDHPQVKNFLQEPGFEDGGSEWIISSPEVNPFVTDHSNYPNKTPTATTENQKVGVIQYDSDQSVTGADEYGFEQNPIFHVRPEPDAGLRVQWSGYQHEFMAPQIQVNNGGVTFGSTSVALRSGSLSGEVSLPVDPITAPIGKGATVHIWDSSFSNHLSKLTLSERAEKGAEQIVGSLDEEVPASAELYYVEPTTNSSASISVQAFVPKDERERWAQRQIYIPYQDTAGNQVANNTFSIKMGVFMATSGAGIIRWLFDDWAVQPVRGGQPFDQTISNASIGEIGRTDDLGQRIGSGPSENINSRIIDGFRWGVGGPTPTDNWPISELRARQRERYFRQQNDRFTVSLLVEDKNPQIAGHETIKLNGDYHRVTAIESKPSEGRLDLTLLQHKDYGTA